MIAVQQTSDNALAQHERPITSAGPILVASDAKESSDSAFTMAKVLAAHTSSSVSVISVLNRFSTTASAFALGPAVLEYDNLRRADGERAAYAQRERLAPTWPLEIRDGEATREIGRFAKELSAWIIVTGRGRHSRLERMFRGDTLLRLLQVGELPVLAVEPGLSHLPRRVVVAVDFSEYSTYAARVVLSIAAPDAEVFLVHVVPLYEEEERLMREQAGAMKKEGAERLTRLRAQLETNGRTIHDVLLTGNPDQELIKFAEESKADLIATATHGHGFIRRALLGRVATSLVHGAPCSVLCVPGSALAAAAATSQRMAGALTRTLPHHALDAELSAFAKRNMGRLCTVQVNRQDIGAQVLGHHLPVVGATYDAASKTVSLMLGASKLEGNHLSHVISGVSDVKLSSTSDGSDAVLQCVHEGGYTLIELE